MAVRRCAKEKLEYALENLDAHSFKKFKNKLKDIDYDGVENIPICRLQKVHRLDLGNLMCNHYSEDGAVSVCIRILEEIHEKCIADKLKEGTQKDCSPSATRHSTPDVAGTSEDRKRSLPTTSHDSPAVAGTSEDRKGMPGTPHKQRRMGKKFQAFKSEEQQQLKNYEWVESQAREILNSTHEKLVKVLPPGSNYLSERLYTLKKKTSLDPICIGFLGSTGAGKSSLLNALIGKKLFLPVSGSKTCTACVVQVKRSKSNFCEATIHLLSDQDWKDELKKLVALLNPEDDSNNKTSASCVSDARAKLKALYGDGAEEKSYEELLQTKLKVTIPPKRVIQIKEKEADQLSKALEPYVRVQNQGLNAFWPLLNYVEVTIPGSDILPEGITFVDIPGTGDFNSTRNEMWKKSIDKCSVLWIISAMERVEGESVQETLLDESINAYIGGICTDIALVVTKSDVMDLEEYQRERVKQDTRGPIENEHNAILERNKDVKEKKEGSIKDFFQKKLPPDSELLNKPDLVYTVSAKAFWNKKYLNQEETEIPKLRQYIKEIYMKEKKNLVTDYVNEALGILLLAENFGSEEHLVEQHFQESGVEEFVKKEIDALGKSLDKCFSQIKQPLCEGVEDARKGYEKTVKNMFQRTAGYQGFHKTLKAVCLNNGTHASKIFERIDYNAILTKPIYDKIKMNFDSMFRIERSTRANLWAQLENFQNVVQQKICQIGRDNKLPDDHPKTKTCIHETNVILTRLQKEILQRKMGIYQTLPAAIQDVLKPHYQEASRVRGSQSCQKMQEILRDNIKKEVKNQMFEKAKSKMMSYFDELKKMILTTLEKETSAVLKLILLQQEQLAVKLPDIENECREIKRLHSMLQTTD
ncbi:nuclear GTPase SLIP-GC-like isoform X2 [Hemicordylus capensis]|uniref:nuclear GTPase SLIP-GC-like isoform X2 n=1 Tax=Hemicordylus capensis TaxID=884348 RepID=UPI002302ED70|nr:nuclear GTPase SLIP-GC-like isoform X2 [Hemicordylus capensis]